MKHIKTFESFLSESKINEGDSKVNPSPKIFKDADGNPLVSGKKYAWQGEIVTFKWDGEVLMTNTGIQAHSLDFLKTEDGEDAELPVLGGKVMSDPIDDFSNITKFVGDYVKKDVFNVFDWQRDLGKTICIIIGDERMSGKKPSLDTIGYNEIVTALQKTLGKSYNIEIEEPRIFIRAKTINDRNKINSLLK